MSYPCIVISALENTMTISRYGERFVLHPSGALYWKRKRWLILSDLHLGKINHFRKKGMALPQGLDKMDVDTVRTLINLFSPHRVVFLGDLFHSDYNTSWELLADFTREYKPGFFILVKGNHDILPEWHYGRTALEVVDCIKAVPIIMTHIPLKKKSDLINMAGHLHPGVRLTGRGRQTTRLPAFFFREDVILLPAFGRFTGSICIKPEASDLVIGIADRELVQLV